MRFSLSLKTVEAPVVARAHPSGTLTLTLAPLGVKGTYTCVSGISPGGLLSVGAGAPTEEAVAAEPDDDAAACGPGPLVEVAVICAGVGAGAGEVVVPQPESRMAPVPIAAASRILVTVM
ncbi:hypothetical protein GCM10009721_39690 [Terrabacter tumescens]|uniref:Uncharacterized protein n=1 Tax=Terrabacter tumescens TaxID=60443 RepID=A0ABQ2IET7_9MICO|nr:hypothetical protein GCM10009721_39690 [Terrabacter tumescens]